MSFFEKELRRLFIGGQIMEAIYYEKAACFGVLGRDIWIMVRFVSTYATVRYDALEIVVLDRQSSATMTQYLKFEDIWRDRYIFADAGSGWRICPDVRACPARENEYPFAEADRERLRNAVREFLQPFREQISESGYDGFRLVYICAPPRGDVGRNIEFARQRAREVFQGGEIPICPHLMFPPIADPGNPSEDQAARDMGLRLVALCQQVNVYGGAHTAGMQAEIELAEGLGIPVKYFGTEGKDNAE